MSFDVIDNWHKELEVMNHNKRGRKFDYPDSFMKLLGYEGIILGIKTRKNSSVNTDCYPRQKSVLVQLYNYDLWKISVSYGDRWIAECLFCIQKDA